MKKIIWTLLISSVLVFYLWIGVQFYEDTQSANKERMESFEKLQRELSTPAAMRTWKRLSRKHGWPGVVIYETGKTPYYINAAGKKCRFI